MSFLHNTAALIPHTRRKLVLAALTFIIYFLSAKLGMYVYFDFQTSPALIWPPIGIALAAMLFGGYSMWLPIFCAQFLSIVSEYADTQIVALLISVGYTLQAVVGLFVLHKLGFTKRGITVRNTLLVALAAFCITLIAPAVTTLSFWALGTLGNDIVLSFARSYGAGIFSVLVIVPFIISWYPLPKNVFPLERREWVELLCVFTLLFALNYLLFSTTYLQSFGISVIFFLPVVLTWFALRFHPCFMTLALLLTAIAGILGTIIARPTDNPLNEQLLAVEVYIGFIAAIFLVFVAVVEERRNAFRKLEKALRRTQASDRAKNEFIAVLAHELRNPLAPIVSALEFLHLQPQTDEARHSISVAEDHAMMMRRLLDDLLDTVRLSQRKFQLHKEVVSLQKVVRQSIDSVREFMRTRGHTFAEDIPQEDILAYADPIRLKQILINLLNNACKYTDEGGHIFVLVKRQDGKLLVEISDTGRGIAQSELLTVFEPFRQTGLDSGRGTGLGIGLHLAKQLIEMHGGTIEAKSRGLGLGSTFCIFLPSVQMAPVKPKAASSFTLSPEKAKPEVRPEVQRGESKRVLIVDDNIAAAQSLEKLLSYHGLETAVEYSGESALSRISLWQPHVVLLDLFMPDMHGTEVAQHLRQNGWSGTLIALTGFGQHADIEQTRNAGFDHHLIKPVSTKDVLALVEN